MSINLYGEIITGAVDAIPCQEKRKFHVSFSIDSRDHLVSVQRLLLSEINVLMLVTNGNVTKWFVSSGP